MTDNWTPNNRRHQPRRRYDHHNLTIVMSPDGMSVYARDDTLDAEIDASIIALRATHGEAAVKVLRFVGNFSYTAQ